MAPCAATLAPRSMVSAPGPAALAPAGAARASADTVARDRAIDMSEGLRVTAHLFRVMGVGHVYGGPLWPSRGSRSSDSGALVPPSPSDRWLPSPNLTLSHRTGQGRRACSSRDLAGHARPVPPPSVPREIGSRLRWVVPRLGWWR